MAELTSNFGLTKDTQTDYYNVDTVNANLDKIDKALGNTARFEKAGGTGTAITLTGIELVDGRSKTFIVTVNNNGANTTINGKPLYKPGTTAAPNLKPGKAVTVWYDATGECFYMKELTVENISGAAPLLSPEFTGTPHVVASTDYTTAMMRNIQLTTVDPGADVESTLPNGTLIAVYTT